MHIKRTYMHGKRERERRREGEKKGGREGGEGREKRGREIHVYLLSHILTISTAKLLKCVL